MSEQYEKDLLKLERLRPMLMENGYFALRVVEGRGICGLLPLLFTVGLCYGLDEIGYKGRYCYPHNIANDALIALAVWDGKDDPKGRWIKHKGYEGEWENNLKEENGK